MKLHSEWHFIIQDKNYNLVLNYHNVPITLDIPQAGSFLRSPYSNLPLDSGDAPDKLRG